MSPVAAAAANAMREAFARFDRGAQQTIDGVSGADPNADPASGMVDQIAAKAQMCAAAAVLRAHEEMTARLLDVKA